MESRTLVISLIDYLLEKYDSSEDKSRVGSMKANTDLDFFDEKLPEPEAQFPEKKEQKTPEIKGLTDDFADFDFDSLG